MASSLSKNVLFSLLLLLFLHQSFAKKAHLHFYFEGNSQGPNASVITVVPSPSGLPLGFGAISVLDDILRDGPNENSTLIGHAQGLVVVAGMDGSLETLLNFIFTAGKYNGSSFAVFGKVVPVAPIERAVIGGTGIFRMARGYQIGNVVSASAARLVYEFDTYITY